MELVGTMSSREWNSLGGIFNSDHQEDSNQDDHDQFMAGHDFLGTIGASNLEFPFPICNTYESDESYSYGAYSDDHRPVSFATSNNTDNVTPTRNIDLYLNIECERDDQPTVGTESLPKKRARSDDQDQKSKRNVKPRKSKELSSSDEEEENSNPFPEEEVGGSALVLNLHGKARASRGSATDPQSVYARKRREKINERLRILQNLVPNGTKVDLSTMLEEAVQYVKFLQLQIKLLSSEDLWMYAPLAYNGMDIGIDLSLTIPRQH